MIANVPEQSRILSKDGDFKPYIEPKNITVIKRRNYTIRNVLGIFTDISKAFIKHKQENTKGFQFRLFLFSTPISFISLFKSNKYKDKPLGVQLRTRLTNMGTTYIKLGQILALRSDLLPESITTELKGLFDKSTVVDYQRYEELVALNLKEPLQVVFEKIVHTPLASASIAQVHLATLNSGEEVVIKLLKPGTRNLVETDVKIIRSLGSFLQKIVPSAQPEAMLNEFCEYTLREVDFRLEANNAEEFARNFISQRQVVFPKIYKQYSNANMIVMEYIKGDKPDVYAKKEGVTDQMRSNVVDIGAGAIIKMLYNDGFFHADLHPGNLIVINENKCAFIDLGMVGRFSESTRKNLLYYINALVLGNAEAAARYMSLVTKPGKNADIQAFRKAFVEIADNYYKNANFNDFSIAELIMVTSKIGAQYDMYYPMELILMSKAMVTFEGVGALVKPDLDIVEVSKKHVRKLLIREVKPMEILKASLYNAPEFIDMFMRGPGLFVEVLNHVEQDISQPKKEKTASLKFVILAGYLIIAAAIVYGTTSNYYISGALILVAILLALKK